MTDNLIELLEEWNAEIQIIKKKIAGLEEELDEALTDKQELEKKNHNTTDQHDQFISRITQLSEELDEALTDKQELKTGVFIKAPTLQQLNQIEDFIAELYPNESDREKFVKYL